VKCQCISVYHPVGAKSVVREHQEMKGMLADRTKLLQCVAVKRQHCAYGAANCGTGYHVSIHGMDD
jgi:hypothetical protein